ncbi:hypothetical protein FOCC_FOCC011010 [Frankliniella occidentalis]|nr:hypothetical protein FOCC_FOCC011010 [Frankliniella occidentalis]
MPAQESDSRSSSLSARSGERGAGGGVDSNFGTVCAEPVTDEVLGAKTWLKNSDKPWTVVLQKWRTTAPIRFREFLAVDSDPNSVNIYINEWKILKHKSGYELLLEDFKCLYPDVASNLFIKWELFVRRNIAIGKKDVSKSDVKGNQILQELANEALSPNSQAVLLLALLPSIRANQRVKVNGSQVKVSESECRDSYLLHVKNANDLPLAIRNRREEFSQSVKPGGQPLICAIGPSLADVRSVHVNVANLDWVATSALCAIDICFKSFFALSIPYPKESEHVWSTIQRAVYDIKTPSDKDMNFCHSWIKALKCHLCLLWEPSIDDLLSHLQVRHTITVWSTIVCAQEGDGIGNNLFNNGNDLNNDGDDYEFLNDGNNDDFNGDDNVLDDNLNAPEVLTLESFVSAVYKNAEMFSAYLYSIPTLNRKNVELIIAGFSDFLGFGIVKVLKQRVVAFIDACTCENINPNDIFDIKGMFDVIENPFEHLSSEFKRISTVSDTGKFIRPDSYVLNYENRFVRDDLDVELSQKPVTVQVVPLRKSIKVFLEIPGMYQCMLDHVNAMNVQSEIVKDFLQGELWQETLLRFEGKTVYPLFLHFDDYEPDNVLGSHAGDNELGAVYASIASLPSELRSGVLNMFLVSLFKSNDRKSSGNLITFQSIIEELKYLEEEGIVLDLPSGKVRIYFVLCLIVADNKGHNSIHGFVESFSASFYCRICRIHKDVAAHTLSALPALRRTRANYEIDVAANNYRETGVKEECAFNHVQSYDVCTNIFVDLLHDISEGCLRYGFGAILLEFIHNRGYFDVQTFHERIDGFNYGPAEFGNKPPKSHITLDRIRNNNVVLSASEAVCLARYFGEMIGDLVPADNLAWQYYIVVREIVEIVTAPYFSRGTVEYLGVIIREHHELYRQLAGYLRPKHHLMTHYPEAMRRNGPFPHYCSLALERKHRQGKLYARTCNSRVNLPLSVAVKVQLEFCHHVMTFDPKVQFKCILKVNTVRAASLPNFNLFRGVLPFTPNHLVSVTKGVDVRGTQYRVHMVVVLHVHDLLPVFGKINNIFITNDGPMFLVKQMLTQGYRSKFCSFVVHDANQYVFVSQKQFVSFMPLWQRTSQDGEQVVSVRHAL